MHFFIAQARSQIAPLIDHMNALLISFGVRLPDADGSFEWPGFVLETGERHAEADVVVFWLFFAAADAVAFFEMKTETGFAR